VVARRILAIAFVLAFSSSAGAEDLERAQELFEKGRALVTENKHAEACPLFEEALGLGAGLGTELNLATCWSKIGRLVDARKMFQAILGKTKTPELAKARLVAEQSIADIDERMPKLQIERGALSSSATIYLDGVELVDTSDPIPVDPGTHVIEAEGAAKQTVTAVEKQVTEVILVAGEETGGIGAEVPKKPSWFDGDRRPLYLGGAGAALILTGTITGILTLSKRSDGIALCEGPETALVCGPEGRDTLDSARTLSHVTTAFFVIGTGLVVTGVIWKLQERNKKPDRPQLTGWISRTSGGFALERTW
jgi:hypothetical protein